MADEQLKFIIGADTTQFNAELQKAENELRQFQAALKKTTDVKALDEINAKIVKTQQTIAGLNNSMKSVAPSTNKASQSITNLSRVLQDAPYGFIGIANNINPLVESFGRLKSESGSVGGALKALVSGLSGPAGLGIAFAAVTSAITFAQIGFQAWTGSSKQAEKQNNKTTESVKMAIPSLSAYEISLNKIAEAEIKNAQGISDLSIVILSNATSIEARNIAIQNLNKNYGEYLSNLDLEIDKNRSLQETLSIISQKQAKLTLFKSFAPEIQDQIKKVNELQLQLEQIKLGDFLSTPEEIASDAAAVQKEINNLLNRITKEIGSIPKLADKLGIKNKGDLLSLFFGTDQTKKSKTDTETLTEALAKFEKSLIAIQATGISLGTPQFEINADKIKEFESILKKIIEKFNVSPKDKVYVDLEARLSNLQFEQVKKNLKDSFSKAIRDASNELNIKPIEGIDIQLADKPFNQNDIDKAYREGLIKQFVAAAKKFGFEIPVGTLTLTTEGIEKKYAELQKKTEEFNKKIREQVTSTFESVAEDAAILFGQTLGDALTGQANVGDFFKGLFASLGANLEELGKFLVKTAIQLEVIQKTLFSNPALALIGGIALIAIGRAISNATKKNAFAVGTRYAPGGMALVGERGPEMINLPRGSQVIPAAQTASMMGGISGAIEVFGMLRGQDIYFSNKKYGQTYKRTT